MYFTTIAAGILIKQKKEFLPLDIYKKKKKYVLAVVDTFHNYLEISQVPTSSKGMTQFQKLGKEVQVFLLISQ